MQDSKVRTILSTVKSKSVAGVSPVDYIDGVLDALPDGTNAAVETASAGKKPLLAADYGNGSRALF